MGYRAFHPDQLFNFQLNRPFSLGYAREEDLAGNHRQIGNLKLALRVRSHWIESKSA